MATRFAPLTPRSVQRSSLRTFVWALMTAYGVPRDEWAIGNTQLFLKAGQLPVLERLQRDGMPPDPEKLQEALRMIVQQRWRTAASAINFVLWLPRFAQHQRQARVQQRCRAGAPEASKARDIPLGAAISKNMDEWYWSLAISVVEAVLSMIIGHGQFRESSTNFDNEWKSILNDGLRPLRRSRAVASLLENDWDLAQVDADNLAVLLELLRAKNTLSSRSVHAASTTRTPLAPRSPLVPRNILRDILRLDVTSKQSPLSSRPRPDGKENAGAVWEWPCSSQASVMVPSDKKREANLV